VAGRPGGGAACADAMGKLLCGRDDGCGAEPTAALLITGCDDCAHIITYSNSKQLYTLTV